MGRGAGPLGEAALRADRRAEGGGLGGTTSVLARTASGEVQPSAWLAAWVAAAIKSGAAVTLDDVSAAAGWPFCQPRWQEFGYQAARSQG